MKAGCTALFLAVMSNFTINATESSGLSRLKKAIEPYNIKIGALKMSTIGTSCLAWFTLYAWLIKETPTKDCQCFLDSTIKKILDKSGCDSRVSKEIKNNESSTPEEIEIRSKNTFLKKFGISIASPGKVLEISVFPWAATRAYSDITQLFDWILKKLLPDPREQPDNL